MIFAAVEFSLPNRFRDASNVAGERSILSERRCDLSHGSEGALNSGTRL